MPLQAGQTAQHATRSGFKQNRGWQSGQSDGGRGDAGAVVECADGGPAAARYVTTRMIWSLQKLHTITQPIRDALSSAPEVLQDVCAFMKHKYRELRLGSEGARAALLITGVNTAVWLAWKVPRLQPFMRVHFRHDPLSGKVYTTLTSIFSHETLLDLFASTLLLYTSSRAASVWMEQEQDQPGHLNEGRSIYHVLAFFISANLFSSLFFHLTATRILYPRMVKQLAQNMSKPGTSPLAGTGTPRVLQDSNPPFSGSIGAVFAGFTMMALMVPGAPIYPPSLPELSFPFAYCMGGVILFDCIGALRGWRPFDHYTHLGGTVFGVLYWMGGARLWEWTRRHVWGEKPGENERSAKRLFKAFRN
ncbi:hypothetical protein EVG20_g817 [Dentipellis fragilis]|uniref:Peptidase S54 rhomboid domain-containing protein n=1 Tax=Dentipellis fragilis TaxID=205917 RepID=A0A4Y9ZBM1_9AGAM|nr:hypothetical protein EVG20_g817 [Dentipellis fragilis]